MTHKPTVLITGATDGLGRALAQRLALEGTTLALHGRDPEKLARTADGIAESNGLPRPLTFVADLSELAQAGRLVAEVLDKTDRLDVLVNNAGIGMGLPEGRSRATSKDGYELRFAVNYLAGFLLTVRLLPLLRRSAPARVVNVASLGQHPIDFDDLMIEQGYSGLRAYGQSKLAQIMFGFELANRVPAAEVTVNSLHPGTYMPTKMVLQEIGHSVDTIDVGVAATHRLVAYGELAGVTGRFFDRQREARANAQAYDAGARAQLWERSLELVGETDVP
jgi:NAD(P)-dependent dehydrogenase (short-subunit alcohol dehydrogenase family)